MARPLPVVEMFYNGAWQVVTEDVYSSEGSSIKILRGRTDWAKDADPAEATIPFRQDKSEYATAAGGGPLIGRYAPENPMSDLYGLIGRNTPVRVRLGASQPRLHLAGPPTTPAATTPDTAALRLTGDQRVEILVKPRAWVTGSQYALARRYVVATGGRALGWWVTETGAMSFRYSSDGNAFTTQISGATIPTTDAERWLAAWIDVANGANHIVGFETSLTGAAGSWSALGANVTVAGNITIHPAQVPLEVGRVHAPGAVGIGVDPFAGEIGAFRYRSGILATSTIVSSVDFRTAEATDTTIVDDQGRTWTLTAGAYISDSSVRMTGEAAAWPQAWNETNTVRSANVTVAGVSRRAQRHQTPLQSSLRRDLSTKSNVVAYWPLEEPKGAARWSSGLAGDSTTLKPSVATEVTMGASDTFVASDPLPEFRETDVFGRFPSYTPNVSQRLIFLVSVPSEGIAADRNLGRFFTAGTAARWDIVYAAGGGLRVRAYDSGGALLLDLGPSAANLDGAPVMMSLWLEQQGANVFYQAAVFNLGGSAIVHAEGTLAGRTYGRFTSLICASTGGMEGTTLGHIALLNGDVHSIWDTIGTSLVAWAGETAAARLLRLGADEGFPVRISGAGADVAMGPQRSRTFVQLLREVPATDLGILQDADDAVAFDYRPASDMMASHVLELPYYLVAPPFQPTNDDKATVNRVTTTSATGDRFTAEDTTSTMSVLPPPAGVGLYDQAADINTNTETDTAYNAWWRLALGTVPGSRWPDVVLHLDHPDVALIADEVLALRAGDIIRITDLPAGVPPGPVDLIINAIEDQISRPLHTVTFTCEPGKIWAGTGVWAAATGPWPADVARWDSSDTARGASAITTTQTTITLLYGSIAWTTDPTHFPFDIMAGGERMRVTSISAPGGGSQLFTVVRSVNGIVKGHPAGTAFSLADPTYWAL